MPHRPEFPIDPLRVEVEIGFAHVEDASHQTKARKDRVAHPRIALARPERGGRLIPVHGVRRGHPALFQSSRVACIGDQPLSNVERERPIVEPRVVFGRKRRPVRN